MAYNTRYVFVAFTVPTAANFNNNDENLDFLKTQVDTTICNGRLTLESGVPISTSDQTAKTTLYFTPYKGNRIGLKSGSSWDLYSFTEKSLSLSGYIKGVVYDIFAYLSSGAPVLESLAWKKVTASNSPTSGSGKTINISDTGDLAVGREVTVKDGANSEITTITALVANTSITVDLANSYTTPDVYGFNTRATSLTLDDGKWVKSGATTRRYLGTIRITSTTGQCEDSEKWRGVWNAFNQMGRSLKCNDSTNSWLMTSSWAAANSNVTYGVGRVSVVIGLNESCLQIQNICTAYAASSIGGTIGIGVNSQTVNSAPINPGDVYIYAKLIALLNAYLNVGAYYLQRIEKGSSSVTVYGDNGNADQMGGLYGSIVM